MIADYHLHTLFSFAGRWRRFCSDQCRVTYHHQKILAERRKRTHPQQICPNCGKEFQPEWGAGSQRKFCSDECRIEWWKEYHKAHPPEELPSEECAFCGAALTGKQRGQTYCSRFLLSAGNGSDPCGGNLRVVRRKIHR